MNEAESRPDPDQILIKIKAEEEKARRGRLKIFFGASAGVGKTYAMLSHAHELYRNGTDVLVGIVETHLRPETEKLLQGLNVLPPITVPYRGVELYELDLETALRRKPDVMLVDELAHTNAPNQRHPKRWQDVLELLDAGIDVFTTLNVQHIESLSDLVAGTTGVWQKETVPDSIFDSADEVVLVDIDADELLKRLSEGKVYVAQQAKARAAENFFKKNNLIALRELALRRTAERVDAEMVSYISAEGVALPQPIADKILACIAPGHLSSKIIRTTRRMAAGLKAPWEAVYVEKADFQILNERGRQSLDALGRMIERMGGKMVVLQGDDTTDTVLSYARKHGFTKVVAGKLVKPFWNFAFRERFVEKLIRKSGAIDIYVVTDESKKDKGNSSFSSDLVAEYKPHIYAAAFLLVIVTSLVARSLQEWLSINDTSLLYIVTIAFIASVFGRGPGYAASVASALLLNILFVPPFGLFTFADTAPLMSFFLMAAGGFLLTNMISKLRLQTMVARAREARTQLLYRLTRELTSLRGKQNVSDAVARNVTTMLDVNTTIWLSSQGDPLVVVVGTLPQENFVREMGVLQWTYDNKKIAGRGTDTMPSADGLYFPLATATGLFGVMGIFPRVADYQFSLDEISSVETIATLLSSALERVRTGELAEQAKIKAESEKLLIELQKARAAIIKTQESVSGKTGK